MARQVLPEVALFFPCDEAVLGLDDGKWSLKNPWHTVQMPGGVSERFVQREIWLYAQLTGGVGTYGLSVELRDVETGIRIGKPSEPERREFVDRIVAIEVVFRMSNVPFPRPGLYEFKLIANHAECGSCNLRVLPG